MSASEADLDVSLLSKTFPNTGEGPAGGVQGANFALASGTFFTLLGPSGCGKTTTLRCIAGLERPDCGVIRLGDRVFFDHTAGTNVPLNLRNIGMVFQSYAIWPHMTVFENVAFPLRVAKDRRYRRDEIDRQVDEALDSVELLALKSRSATRLSGGQQQRVALARAIVRKPRLLLLDEPLSNLDAALREEMRKELKKLQAQIGVTTVYVTHDQTEALEMSDRIAVMQHGRIVQLAPPRDIYQNPTNAFVAGFVGSTNWLKGVAHGDGTDTVVTLDNSPSSIRCTQRNAALEGRDVLVSVRPERITLRDVRSLAPDRGNRLVGRVSFAGFSGGTMRYQVSSNELAIQAYGSPDSRWNEGDEVCIDFGTDAAFIFEAEPR
jgi:ABC-type Fe3+/spermidine/putrescine transport system ATPase subunit